MSMSIYINVSAYKLSSSLDIWDIHLFDVLNWDVANLPIPHWKMESVFDFRTDLSLPSLFRDPSWCFGGISTLLEINKFFGTKKTSHCGHHDNQSHACGLRLSSVERFLANVPQGNHTKLVVLFFWSHLMWHISVSLGIVAYPQFWVAAVPIPVSLRQGWFDGIPGV